MDKKNDIVLVFFLPTEDGLFLAETIPITLCSVGMPWHGSFLEDQHGRLMPFFVIPLEGMDFLERFLQENGYLLAEYETPPGLPEKLAEHVKDDSVFMIVSQDTIAGHHETIH